MSYRNIVYDPYLKEVVLYTWDENGQRVEEREDFKPYLYIEHPQANDAVSIYNTPLKKLEFEESFKRRDFVKSVPKTYYNLQPEQQYLIDKYLGLNKSKDFSKFPLKIFFLDIETFSENGFPDPQEANDTINLISVWDSLKDAVYTFGLQKEYFTQDERVIYRAFATETEMIRGFIRWWRKDFPDVVSGWNSDAFDMPYLCNRINKLYKDPKAVNRLSPVDRVYKRDDVHKRLADYKELWTISGITSIDYMYLYKVFSKSQHASYSLDNIGEEELGKGKLAHNAVSLTDLATNDWHKFVDYNIQDVRLLVQLEDKLQFLSTCREIAYQSLSPIINTLGTIGVVTGLAAQKGRERDRIISTFTPVDQGNFEGGYVKEPQSGLRKSLLYFDANSLYPNTMVTLNVSPETKIAKVTKTDKETGSVNLTTIYGKEYTLTKEKYDAFIKREQIAISESNVLFTQKSRGIFPDIIEEIYATRVALKKQLSNIKQQMTKTAKNDIQYKELKNQAQLFDVKQYTTKILLNRIYGFFAEKHSPLYDIDLASSITSTGQACIKKAADICERYIKDTYNLEYDPIVMSDTDSVVVTIDPILEQLKESFLIDNKINTVVFNIANDLNKTIDLEINKWATDTLNSTTPKYEFKRENISSSGAFLKKKHYILNIRDDEGKAVDEFIYKGVEVVRTSTPKKVKPLIKTAIENIIKVGDKKEIEKLLEETYIKYQTLSTEDIAMSMSLNGYDKYKNQSSGFNIAKRTPFHVKSSIYYNLLLEKFTLLNKYESLKSGDKIKFMYLMPNRYDIKSIAFLDKFPEEFKVDLTPDTTLMFEKSVLKPIYRVLTAINWDIRSPLLEEKVDLLDLFS